MPCPRNLRQDAHGASPVQALQALVQFEARLPAGITGRASHLGCQNGVPNARDGLLLCSGNHMGIRSQGHRCVRVPQQSGDGPDVGSSKEINDEYSLDLMALDFASLVFDEGNPESAVTLLTDQFARGFNALMVPRIFVTHQLGILEYLLPLGRYEEMLEYARRALSGALDQHLDVSATQALGWLATIATLRAPRPKLDVDARAARVLGFVEARLQTLGSAPQNHELTLAALREAMGAGTAAKLMAEGAKMTEDETVESALML